MYGAVNRGSGRGLVLVLQLLLLLLLLLLFLYPAKKGRCTMNNKLRDLHTCLDDSKALCPLSGPMLPECPCQAGAPRK